MVKKVSDGFRATAFWTQGAEGGFPLKSKWIRVMEPTTKLDSPWGPIGVSEEAHISAIPLWKKGVFGHIDHDKDPNREFTVDIQDAKWVPGEGMYVQVDGDNPAINMLKEGKAKPSIEIDVADQEDYDGKNRRVKRYIPTGIGIMINGEANGKNVGAFEPNLREAIGGKMKEEGTDMENEIDQEAVDSFLTDFGSKMKENPEETVQKVSEYRKGLNELYGDKEVDLDTMTKFVDIFKSGKEQKPPEKEEKNTIGDKKYKDLLEKFKEADLEKKKKEEILAQMQTERSEFEKVLIDKTIEEARKSGIHVDVLDLDGKSYEEVVKAIDYHKKLVETYKLGNLPGEDNPRQGAKPPGATKLFDEKGYVTNDAFDKAVKEIPIFQKDENKFSNIFKKQ